MKMTKKLTTERDYYADILRIILMIMIVLHHAIVDGLDLNGSVYGTSKNPVDSPIIFIVNALCIVAVNSFFAVSGFFRIKTNF